MEELTLEFDPVDSNPSFQEVETSYNPSFSESADSTTNEGEIF